MTTPRRGEAIDRLRWLGGLWFGLAAPVSQRAYLASGFFLAAVKYAIDAAIVGSVTGQVWTPLDYLMPGSVLRVGSDDGPLLLVMLAAVALPFAWIGASMSVRRAIDAGLSGWLGLLFLVPVVNYVVIAVLAMRPSAPRVAIEPPVLSADGAVGSAFAGLLAGTGAGLVMVLLSAHGLESYGAALFVGTPFVMGAVAGGLYNRRLARTPRSTVAVGILAVMLAGVPLLLVALEGVLCILMAAPMALPPAMLGALAGRAVLLRTNPYTSGRALVPLLVLPLFAVAERAAVEPPVREVVSVIEIDAPPAAVWRHVVGFSDIDAAPAWYFRLGIAHPLRARIEGHGVGAVRHCEFSTGSFVEPITAWDEPRRLAFDVVDQPPPMVELSPWDEVHAPHLDGTMRSLRGEFRLIPLGGARTRLEGSTWYVLEMQPAFYWRPWAEGLVHGIHHRVLEHVKALSERAP